MDRGVKIAAATSVLLCGMATAMLFRQEPPVPHRPTVSQDGERFVLRRFTQSESMAETQPVLDMRSQDDTQRPPLPAAVVVVERSHQATLASAPSQAPASPLASAAKPPALAKSFPRAHHEPAVKRPAQRPMAPPSASLRPFRTPAAWLRKHTVVNGDTLPSLALRYLGSADRYREIYEANRPLLANPDILLLGVELTIPRREPPSRKPLGRKPLEKEAGVTKPERRLVPIGTER